MIRRRCRTPARESTVGSTSVAHPDTASLASVSGVRISRSSPVASRTRPMNSGPLPATRQACVATRRARETPWRSSLPAHTFKRVERAAHGEFGQRAGLADAFAQADDARERIDHAEAAPRRAAPAAGGNCWCRDRARHRTAPSPLAVASAMDLECAEVERRAVVDDVWTERRAVLALRGTRSGRSSALWAARRR